MKYLFVIVVVIFVVVNYGNAECGEEDSKIVKECYDKFIITVNLRNSHAAALIIGSDEKFCEHFHEHQGCIRNGPKCYLNASLNEAAKVFGTNVTDVYGVLLIEYAFQYACDHDFSNKKMPQKDAECFATLKEEDLGKECGHPKDCKGIKEFPPCMKKALIKKCKNEEASKVYADAFEYALKKVLANCN